MKFLLPGIMALFIMLSIQVGAQEHSLSGQIIDRDTREGISYVTVSASPTNGVVSDSVGFFTIEITKYPVELTISHLSYGVQSFTLNFSPKENLVFQLEQLMTNIPEILVSGKKLQSLTKGADFSIMSFEFDNKYMWLIGMVNNNRNRARIFLANLIGDTLHSVPIRLPASFRKDFFGNVHVETKDSIYQLFGLNDSVQLHYGTDKEEFLRTMGTFQTTLGPGLVYFKSDLQISESRVFYIDQTLSEPKPILIIKDLPDDHSWLPPGLRQMGRILGHRTVQQILDQQRGYFRALVDESIFKLKDSLYVVDLNNDKIHTIGPDQQLIRSVPISFHHQPNPTLTNLFKNYDDIMTDPMDHKAYVVYHKNNNWKFVPLDPHDGQTSTELPIPKFNAMNNIRIHGGAVYFTYPEKLYPYFQRVFRMVIPNE